MQSQFSGLKVWQKGKDLVREIYLVTKTFPSDELYGIVSQMRRAAVSVPVNIAEGKGRFHKKEYIQFLFVARGSLYELETLIQISFELKYLSEEDAQRLQGLCSEVIAMLNGLISAVR